MDEEEAYGSEEVTDRREVLGLISRLQQLAKRLEGSGMEADRDICEQAVDVLVELLKPEVVK